MPLTVNVCRKCKNHDCIVDILRTRTDVSVELVRCQKICHGPVVGLPIAIQVDLKAVRISQMGLLPIGSLDGGWDVRGHSHLGHTIREPQPIVKG